MQTFKYRNPYRPTQTELKVEYLSTPCKLCYNRYLSVITKYGIVLVSDLDWETNNGMLSCTFFSTFFNGQIYSASTTFIKKILNVPKAIKSS